MGSALSGEWSGEGNDAHHGGSVCAQEREARAAAALAVHHIHLRDTVVVLYDSPHRKRANSVPLLK